MTKPLDPRPCKLQVNTTGAWRNVLDFDVSVSDDVMQAAAQLFACETKATLRIIIPGDTAPLMTWSCKNGWRPWRAAA